MKTTKVVPIEICDICGQETSPQKCAKCGKEVCQECMDTFTVRVTENQKPDYVTYGYKRSSFKTTVDFYAWYCTDCGRGIETVLLSAGFQIEKNKDA